MEHKVTSYLVAISLLLAFILFSIVGFYSSFFEAFGILVGAGWGCTNLYFLQKLLQEWLRINSRNVLKLYTITGIKFPLLYLIGYGILKGHLFPIPHLLLGFSLTLIAIFLFGLIILFKRQAKTGSEIS